MIRERFISDNPIFNEEHTSSLNPQTYQANIKPEILDEQLQSSDTAECPISIKPAAQTTSNSPNKPPTTATSEGLNAPLDTTKESERENPIEFPVFEIEDSSDENAIVEERHPKETIITGNDFKFRRSRRNVGPPHFYA